MRNLKLKVCGMRDPKNILDVAVLRPDFMGFIFYKGSKRYVGENFSIPQQFPKSIKRVGVFVNESVQNILNLVEKHRLDYVQLHGDESKEICEALKSKAKVIKVFRVGGDFDFDATKEFVSCADYFLFDTKSDAYGGSGKTFDWNSLIKYDQAVPFFLSGGLSIRNIDTALSLPSKNLFALDFNSGVEIEPGVKDKSILNSIFQILNTSSNAIHR